MKKSFNVLCQFVIWQFLENFNHVFSCNGLSSEIKWDDILTALCCSLNNNDYDDDQDMSGIAM